MLRTPLTGLRLELEDLTLRDDVAPDVQESARHGLASVDEVNAVVGELVDISRSGSLVAGAELPLVDLATQLAQRWSDRLAERDRSLTASAEGDLALSYTPGPVEHVLDLVLAEVVRRGSGAVRIVFHGEDSGHLRVKVTSTGPARAADGSGDARHPARAGPRRRRGPGRPDHRRRPRRGHRGPAPAPLSCHFLRPPTRHFLRPDPTVSSR